MDEIHRKRIEDLRKKSRILLAQVDENSKRIKKEIHKLRSCNSTFGEEGAQRKNEQSRYSQECTESWKLRNDSREVRGVLCPDYYGSDRNGSMPNKPRKLLITSKKHTAEKSVENVKRKPIKECYCNAEVRKIQPRSTWTQHKHTPSFNRCRSAIEVKPAAVKESQKPILASPFSCETLRRMEQIDYTPRSNFLRYVQNKVSLLQNAQTINRPQKCQSLTRNREFPNENNLLKVSSEKTQITIGTQTSKEVLETEEISEEEDSQFININQSMKEIPEPVKKQPKTALVAKRILSSKKSSPESKKNKSHSSVPTKGKNTQTDAQCPCCQKKESEKTSISKKSEKYYYNPEDHEEIDRNEKIRSADRDVTDLRKFREQNYFDTHGSSRTLLSSNSSGSLEQFVLNERLFPDASRKVHRKDLVVTMPACATVQRKRIHYFPRYIVRQEKISCNANSKKRRHHNCPLTGHTVDLGVLKQQPPMNSLALKYQKRLTC